MGEIRIVGPGETHRHPYPVCKKIKSGMQAQLQCGPSEKIRLEVSSEC